MGRWQLFSAPSLGTLHLKFKHFSGVLMVLKRRWRRIEIVVLLCLSLIITLSVIQIFAPSSGKVVFIRTEKKMWYNQSRLALLSGFTVPKATVSGTAVTEASTIHSDPTTGILKETLTAAITEIPAVDSDIIKEASVVSSDATTEIRKQTLVIDRRIITEATTANNTTVSEAPSVYDDKVTIS